MKRIFESLSKSHRRDRRRRAAQIEALGERALLAAQLISSDAATKTVSAGETIDIPVIYQTLDGNNDPAALRGWRRSLRWCPSMRDH